MTELDTLRDRAEALHLHGLVSHWPEVATDGTSVTLRRPGLEVAVNLGPAEAGGLPGWGWRVSER